MRKPGAFENYRYREELFPTSRFRMAFDLLEEQRRHQGSKEYLGILELAARESEVRVDAALLVLLGPGDEPISAAVIEAMLGAERSTAVAMCDVAAVDLRVFDQLFSGAGGAAMSAAPQIRTALMENLKDTASACDARVLRAGRATGRERDAQLRAVPASS